jgi:hypothetical protein
MAGAKRGLIRRVLDFVSTDDDEPEDIDPDPVPAGPFPIAHARSRERVDFIGEITSTAVTEQPHAPWFEAELDDGTGQVILVWMGRHGVPGVKAGRRLRVQGRLAPDRGRLVVFNPRYAFEPLSNSANAASA